MWTNILPPELLNTVHCMDCLEFMKWLPDGCIDMILCDLPYWTTACSWDIVIPFEPLRIQYKRLIKENWAIVLFWSQPFTTDLINSNRKWFRYDLIWYKERSCWSMLCNNRPLKYHEDICIFYKEQPTYNPQMTKGIKLKKASWGKSDNYWEMPIIRNENDDYYPQSVVWFTACHNMTWKQHPTEKPVDLCKRLINTYTNNWELVLDNCAWSWTTGVACKELWRNYILIEKEPKYVDIIHKRLQNTTVSLFHS